LVDALAPLGLAAADRQASQIQTYADRVRYDSHGADLALLESVAEAVYLVGLALEDVEELTDAA
jgi:hypothetical protein